jgi:hypothetical protein
MADSTQLPSNAELQQHMKDAFTKPSASATVLDPSPGGGGQVAEAPMGAEPLSETIPDAVGRQSSYKSPKELYTAPSSGKVGVDSTHAERWVTCQAGRLLLCTFCMHYHLRLLSYAYAHIHQVQPTVALGLFTLW